MYGSSCIVLYNMTNTDFILFKLYQNIKHTLVYDNKTYYELHVVNFQVICLIKNVKFNRRAKTKNKTKKQLELWKHGSPFHIFSINI